MRHTVGSIDLTVRMKVQRYCAAAKNLPDPLGKHIGDSSHRAFVCYCRLNTTV